MARKRKNTPEEVLAEVERVATRRTALLSEADDLYSSLVGLYEEGRAMDPPLTHVQLAKASGVTEDAIPAALRKARQRKAAAHR